MQDEHLKHTITGVAIADVNRTLSVYFGCYGEQASTGGVGLVRVNRHGLRYFVFAVSSSNEAVFGSNLFLVPRVTASCQAMALDTTHSSALTTTTSQEARSDDSATECLCNSEAVVNGQASKNYSNSNKLPFLIFFSLFVKSVTSSY